MKALKNRFSKLISAVEQGIRFMIPRRGVPVARLVAEVALAPNEAACHEHIASRRNIYAEFAVGLVLEGDVKASAR